MRFGIYTNLTRDENGKATKELVDLFRSKGLNFAMSDDLIELNYPCQYLPNEKLAEYSDVLVVFGGDGTILRVVKECSQYNCAIFAVNLGNMGFLTEIEHEKIAEAVDCICKNKVKIEERALIELEFKKKKYLALNEIVIHRGTRTKMVYLDIMLNGIMVDRLRADGLIISSPTGSTAYSLSAGGPIVTPDVDAFIITPICAHSYSSRPFVVNQNNVIDLYLMRADPYATINVDGEEISNMNVNDSMKIKNSKHTVKFLRLHNYNYFDNIVQKLNYWQQAEKV